jgi:hypothetical protein
MLRRQGPRDNVPHEGQLSHPELEGRGRVLNLQRISVVSWTLASQHELRSMDQVSSEDDLGRFFYSARSC